MKTKNTMAVHLSKREFKEKIYDYSLSKDWRYKGDLPAVVDFYADWCAPCRMIAPVLDELSVEYSGRVRVYKVNTEKEPEVSKAFGISSIPTLMFIPGEGKPFVIRGAQSRAAMKGYFERILGKKEERSLLKKIFTMNWS
jgi:thioredoxin 1